MSVGHACPLCTPNGMKRNVVVVDTLNNKFKCESPTSAFYHSWHPLNEPLSIRITQKIPKISDHFPHTCPKCGERAYIGLSQIEHESQHKQDTCK